MAWNRLELAGNTKKSTTWPIQNVGIVDDRVLLKEIGYTLVKKIGTGSFSKVWRAKYVDNDKCELAIKIIRRRKASKEFLEKFLPRELSIIQRVKHPHLLKYYEITDSPTSVYIIMQYAENGTLAELIERQRKISEDMSRIFFKQLVEVVEFLHKSGIVHRDIKCENLLLDKSYKLLLSDFGFARSDVTGGPAASSRTYCGSYAYASPEILANSPYNPFMADVWCMGMVLFNMVVGNIPYKQTDIKQLIVAKKQPPQFPPEPVVSDASKNLIKRMLTLEQNRATINQIKKDPWMTAKFEAKLVCSKPAHLLKTGPSTSNDEGCSQIFLKNEGKNSQKSITKLGGLRGCIAYTLLAAPPEIKLAPLEIKSQSAPPSGTSLLGLSLCSLQAFISRKVGLFLE